VSVILLYADIQAADVASSCTTMGGGLPFRTRLEEAWKVPEAHYEASAEGTFSARNCAAVLQRGIRDLQLYSGLYGGAEEHHAIPPVTVLVFT
jgi:hypothetical protein